MLNFCGHGDDEDATLCGECDINLCGACWCVHRCGHSDRDRCTHPEHQSIYPPQAAVKLHGGGTSYWYFVTLTVNGVDTEMWRGDDWHHGQAAAVLVRRALSCVPNLEVRGG